MNPSRLDHLIIALTEVLSRRAIARSTFASLLGISTVAVADAKRTKKKPCPPCKGRRKSRCKKPLPDGTPCDGGTCQAGSCIPSPPVLPPPPPPAPKCEPADGVKNGTETGIDCGGLCKRCSNGQGCLTRDDCLSAFCANNVCQECGVNQCGGDINGECICQAPTGGGTNICHTAKGVPNSSCTCPPGTRCFNFMVDGCYKPCGAP